MSNKVNIGMIGVGFIGEVHIMAYEQLPEVAVTAICDVHKPRLAEIRDRYSIPASYTDYKEMLKEEKLDGVLIATPEPLHRAPVEAVAAAGLPILLEKPIATTLEDAEAIISAVEKAGVPAVQGISVNWHPCYVALRKRWLTGEFGSPHTAYCARIVNISEALNFQGRCSINEYVACHDLKFLFSILGSDVESVFALRSNSRAHRETGQADSYWNLIKWANGASASVLTTWGMPLAFELVEDECLIIGTNGAVSKDRANRLRFTTDEVDEKVEPNPDLTGLEEYQDQGKHFVEVIRHNVEPEVTLTDGLLVQKVVWAAEESTKTGQSVKVNL